MKDNIIDVISSLSVLDSNEIKEEDSLISIGIDSLKTVNLILELENSFNFIFNDSDLDPENLKTVKNIIDIVSKYVGIKEL